MTEETANQLKNNNSKNIVIKTIAKQLTLDASMGQEPCICFDISNRRIGINTITPHYSLDISDGSAFIGGNLSVDDMITCPDISTVDISMNHCYLQNMMTVSGHMQAIPNLIPTNNNDYITKEFYDRLIHNIIYFEDVDFATNMTDPSQKLWLSPEISSDGNTLTYSWQVTETSGWGRDFPNADNWYSIMKYNILDLSQTYILLNYYDSVDYSNGWIHNGIYVVHPTLPTTPTTSDGTLTLTRVESALSGTEIDIGMTIYVVDGSYNINTTWALALHNAPSGLTIGKDPIKFNKIFGLNNSSKYAKVDQSNIFTNVNLFYNPVEFSHNDISFNGDNMKITSSSGDHHSYYSLIFDSSCQIIVDTSIITLEKFILGISGSINFADTLIIDKSSIEDVSSILINQDQSGINICNAGSGPPAFIKLYNDRMSLYAWTIPYFTKSLQIYVQFYTLKLFANLTISNDMLNVKYIDFSNSQSISTTPTTTLPTWIPDTSSYLYMDTLKVDVLDCSCLILDTSGLNPPNSFYIQNLSGIYLNQIDITWESGWPAKDKTPSMPNYWAPVFNMNDTSGMIYYTPTSDQKLKTNIRPLTRKLDIVNKLNPVYFTWKETGNNDYGFIAQEIETLIPGIINNKMDDNNEITKIYNSTYHSRLIAVITKAIQDLDSDNISIISSLQNRIIKLKEINTILKRQVDNYLSRLILLEEKLANKL